jgi:hypothetical protein
MWHPWHDPAVETLSRHILGHHRYSTGICRAGQAVPRGPGRPPGYPHPAGHLAVPGNDATRCTRPCTGGTCGRRLTSSQASARTTASWTSGPDSRAQGRDWYQKAAASPDSLAGHPTAASTVHRPWDNALFYEEVNYAASYAFERVSGDDHGFYDAWDRYSASRNQSDRSLQTWARTSTSMMPSRCAAACPGSPPCACAMAPPEQNWSFCITRGRRNRAPTVARNRRSLERRAGFRNGLKGFGVVDMSRTLPNDLQL